MGTTPRPRSETNCPIKSPEILRLCCAFAELAYLPGIIDLWRSILSSCELAINDVRKDRVAAAIPRIRAWQSLHRRPYSINGNYP